MRPHRTATSSKAKSESPPLRRHNRQALVDYSEESDSSFDRRRIDSQRNVKWIDMDDFLILPSEDDQLTFQPRYLEEESEAELPIRAFQNQIRPTTADR